MTDLEDDDVPVVSWNIQRGGHDKDGRTHRWTQALDKLADLKPSVALLQELVPADENGEHPQLKEAARRLGGYHSWAAPATRESPHATAVLADPALFEPVDFFTHETTMWHPVCNPVVRLSGTERLLSLASVHLCSYSPEQRAHEARRLTTLGKPGMSTILGGDFNSFPHRQETEDAEPPDWGTIADRSYVAHRTIERGGRRVPDTRPDEILAAEHDQQPPVFKDLGHYAATTLGQSDALQPTASLWREDQGPMQRIDRLYTTPHIAAAALTRLKVVINDEVLKASDHPPVIATFSLAALRRALSPEPANAAA